MEGIFQGLKIFSRYPEIVFGFSTRSLGDMSYRRGRTNQRKFLRILKLRPREVLFLRLSHSNKVARVAEGGKQLPADAAITKEKDLFIFMSVADCAPVLLFDRKKKVFGLVHAGWQGAQNRIVQKAVEKMKEEFSSQPQDILAGIGPRIGPCCFQIDPSHPLYKDRAKWGRFCRFVVKTGKVSCDIPGFLTSQLKEQGLLARNIEDCGLCTFCRRDIFFSHRADRGAQDGRFGVVFGVRKKIMVFGSFDLLHKGHTSLFRQAKRLASFLVVVVAKDSNIEKFKKRKPDFKEEVRLRQVRAVREVDKALLGDEKDILAPIERERPDIVALGYDQKTLTIERLRKDLSRRGLTPEIVRLKPYKSSIYKSHLLKVPRRAIA